MRFKRWLVGSVIFLMASSSALIWAENDVVVIEIEDDEDSEEEETEEEASDEEAEEKVDGPVRVGRIDVIGQSAEELARVPGSASVVTKEDLERQVPTSGNEVLRTMPGVHVRDEEGIGLRPNIGIRGLNPSRSASLLVLEDGVPIALAPYGEPELYYAPAIERMERVELVKGSGSILYGPQTIGGVLNMITPDPPEEFEVTADLRAGNFGYLHGQATVGDTMGPVGYRLSVMHQRFRGARDLNLELTDVTGQLRFELSDVSSLGLKLHFYDEFSNATYLGLTTPQFEADRNQNFAIHDELPVRRFAASTTYEHFFGDNVLFQTTAYGHNITRNWNRQDFDRRDEGRDYERIIDGSGQDISDTNIRPGDGSAIYMRDTMGSRNREFFIAGVEPRATIDYQLGDIDNELIVGARVHGELTLEQRVNSTVADPDDQTVRDDEIRRGLGIAAYALNRFMFLEERLTVSPGIRVENFWNEREILRTRVDGVPTDLDPTRANQDNVLAVIPGIGASYRLIDEATIFAGVHRGFSPPRTKDAVTSDGELLELDAEYSVNYELGVRGGLQDWLSAEVAGFVLDFSNQIIPPSEFGGAVSDDPGDLVNAGETTHYGVEAQVQFDGASLAELDFQLPLGVSYTWVHAEFGDSWDEDLVGNRIPYAPEHRLSTFLRFVHPTGVSAQINGTYITEQYTDKGNRESPSLDGLTGKIDPYFLLDANVSYTYEPFGVTAYLAGKNLTDEYYIASRAPRGIQPGAPRQIFGGVRGQW